MTPEELFNYMQRGAQADANMVNLEQQAAKAAALRGSSAATEFMVDGQGSYAGLIADAINRGRGKQIQRDVDPALAEARRKSALSKTMRDRYNVQKDYDAEQREQQRYAQEREDSMARREMLDMVHKGSGQRVTLVTDGRGGFYDGRGNPVNIDEYVSYSRPSGGGGASSGVKPSASERKDYRLGKRLQGVVRGLANEREAFSDEELEMINSPKIQAAISWIPSASLQRLAEEKVYLTPQVKAYIARLNRVESKLSQLAAGLNVTGYEMKDRQRWSPNAPGITDEERQLRLQNVERDLLGDVSLYEEMYDPEYHVSAYQDAPLKTGGPLKQAVSKLTGDNDGFSVRRAK